MLRYLGPGRTDNDPGIMVGEMAKMKDKNSLMIIMINVKRRGRHFSILKHNETQCFPHDTHHIFVPLLL